MVAPTDSRLVSLTDGPFLATGDMDFATYFPVWPVDDPPGGPLLSARLGCSVDHAQDLLFAGDNEWQRSYHGFRGHSNVRKSPWAKENHPIHPFCRCRELEFNLSSGARHEEVHRCVLSEPGSRFEFQTTSRTHAPYASGIRVIQQYRLSALGADTCHLDLRYLVVYLGPVNGVLRAMIERGVKGGMQTNAKQLREHLGQVLDVVLVPREEARQQAEQYRLHILRSAAELAPTASARSAGPTAKPVRVPLDAWHHSPWHHRLALMLAVSILVLSVLLLLVMLAELLRPGALLPKLSRLSAEALILSWALGRAIDAVTQAIVLPQGSTRAMAASSRPSRLPLALPAAVTRQESSSSSQPLETMGPSEKTAHGDSHLQPIALPALDNDGKPPVLLSTPGAKRRLLSSPVEFGSPSRSNLGSPRPRLRLAVNVGGFELEL